MPFWEFFLLITFTALGLFLYLYRSLKIKYDFLSTQHNNIQNLIKSIPYAWCSWNLGEEQVICSKEFLRLLGLSENINITLSDILKIFGKSPFCSFNKSLEHLYSFGGEFFLQVSLDNIAYDLEIKGSILQFNHNNQFTGSSNDKKQVIILSLRDITDFNIEQKKLETVQKKQSFELELFHNLSKFIPIVFWARDYQGRISYCNQIYADVLNTTVARVTAENLELLPDNAEYGSYKLFQTAIDTNERQTTRQHVVLMGERRLLEFTEIPIKGLKKTTIGYAIDISDIEKLENEFTFFEKSQREFLNHLSTPIASYSSDGRLDFFNSAYVKTFHLNENWLITKPPLTEVLDELRRKRAIPEYSDFLAHKNDRLKLFNNIFEPINEILYQPNGQVLRMTTIPNTFFGGLSYIFEDITDKINLERGYNTLMAVQKEAIDNLYEGILILGSDYKIRIFNKAFKNMWQVEDSFSMEQPISDIFDNHQIIFCCEHEFESCWQSIKSILNDRKPFSSIFNFNNDKLIGYSYVPLPDGSHLLNFLNISDAYK